MWNTNFSFFGVSSFYTAHVLKLKFVSRRKLNEINKGNIDKHSKGVDLKIIFINNLWENNKVINFSDNFLYFA